MSDVTIKLNSDGTFVVDGKKATLRKVINLARERRDAANAEKKAEREAKRAAKKAEQKKKAEAALKRAQARLEKLNA